MREANKEESRPMYRPNNAKLLAKHMKFVKLMAVCDHNFRCHKLQFCTVEIRRWKASRRNWKSTWEIQHLSCSVLLWYSAGSFLPSDLGF